MFKKHKMTHKKHRMIATKPPTMPLNLQTRLKWQLMDITKLPKRLSKLLKNPLKHKTPKRLLSTKHISQRSRMLLKT